MGSVYDIDAPDVMTALHGLHPDTWGNDAACFAAPPALHKGPNQPCRRAPTSPAEGPQPALQKGPNQPCRRAPTSPAEEFCRGGVTLLQGWGRGPFCRVGGGGSIQTCSGGVIELLLRCLFSTKRIS